MLLYIYVHVQYIIYSYYIIVYIYNSYNNITQTMATNQLLQL